MALPQTRAEWVAAAAEEIRALLTTHHAVVRPELFARLSERYFESDKTHFNFDPHIVSLGLNELESASEAVELKGTTRGGREIKVIRLTRPMPGAATAVETTTSRKRILYARYLSWAQGSTRYPHGRTGPAAEAAARACLIDAQSIALSTAGGTETRSVLGTTLSGPLDAAGWIIMTDAEGIPTQPAALLVEVKNLRQWIYPEDAELWQVLGKAVEVSTGHPSYPVVPVLICRRAHPSSRWMAKQLGFMIIEMFANFVDDAGDEDLFNEVRTGLNFHDLKLGSTPSQHMRKQLRDVLPKHASRFAERWHGTMGHPQMVGLIQQLSNRKTKATERRRLVAQLDLEARKHGMRGWRRNS